MEDSDDINLDSSAELFEHLSDNEFESSCAPNTIIIVPDEDTALSNGSFTSNDLNVDRNFRSSPVDFLSNASAQVSIQNDSMTSFCCPFCNTTKEDVYSLELHIETTHPELGSRVDKSLPYLSAPGNSQNASLAVTTNNSSLFCPFCDTQFDNESNLTAHIDSAHKEIDEGAICASNTPKTCPVCGKVFLSEPALEDHIDTHLSSTSSSSDFVAGAVANKEAPQSKCPVCDFYSEDYAILVSHVESHFNPLQSSAAENGHVQGSSSSSSSHENLPSSSRGKSKSDRNKKPQKKRNAYQSQYQQSLEKMVVRGELSPGEYHERMSSMKDSHHQGIDEGQSKVNGLYENIAAAYQRLHSPNQHAILCDPTDYYCGSFGDKGWGCGFRNLQMMISCLARIPKYAEILFPDGNRQVPSVCKLQQMIEDAWRKGFDLEGCAQLNGKVVNTRKWIGATEVVAMFSSMGIKCEMADFHRPTGSDGSHPRLLEWVYNYFSQASENKPPLYLQHQGHSRTIAGVEVINGVIKLILFDPGSSFNRLAPLAKNPMDSKYLRMFRRPPAAFKAQQYQIVAVIGTLTPTEYEEHKILGSTRVS